MKKVVLCILDGWGHIDTKKYNAILSAKTPFYNHILDTYPHSLLEASGSEVGLPDGQMGNSEVGHLTIGAGRRIYQDLPRISMDLENGEFVKKLVLQSLITRSKVCHIVGLISDGGVHGHVDHIIKIARMLKDKDIKILLHAITDGRDVAPKSCLEFIKKVQDAGIEIASLSGRFYAMDRDKRWDRVQKAYDAIALGKSPSRFDNPVDYINSEYASDITDEFINPACSSKFDGIKDGASILFTNYRADRMRQICLALLSDSHTDLHIRPIKFSYQVVMRPYSQEIAELANSLYPFEPIAHTLGNIISDNGIDQLRIAETEKYAHVTYFFNGGEEKLYKGEDRILVNSPKVATYDLKPDMSANQITEKLVEAIATNKYGFICANYANADMVGHTGVMDAAVSAVETIDECLKKLHDACKHNGYVLLITADHGNAECMFDDETHQPLTSHTTNKVPFICIDDKKISLRDGELADVAPTILSIMGIEKPSDMSGKSLIKK